MQPEMDFAKISDNCLTSRYPSLHSSAHLPSDERCKVTTPHLPTPVSTAVPDRATACGRCSSVGRGRGYSAALFCIGALRANRAAGTGNGCVELEREKEGEGGCKVAMP